MSRRKCSSSRCVFFPEPHKKRLRSADVAAADVAGSIGMEAWDHFNAWGSMEGRIWHSELCNEDGTNKRSMCEVKHTTDQYESSKCGPLGAVQKVVSVQPTVAWPAPQVSWPSLSMVHSCAQRGAHFHWLLVRIISSQW